MEVCVIFQWSLSRLMATLNQANPFFIRCIKSNAEKLPCRFDDILVLRQLRYTGMLATVRIRQSGYNYRLTFEVNMSSLLLRLYGWTKNVIKMVPVVPLFSIEHSKGKILALSQELR